MNARQLMVASLFAAQTGTPTFLRLSRELMRVMDDAGRRSPHSPDVAIDENDIAGLVVLARKTEEEHRGAADNLAAFAAALSAPSIARSE